MRDTHITTTHAHTTQTRTQTQCYKNGKGKDKQAPNYKDGQFVHFVKQQVDRKLFQGYFLILKNGLLAIRYITEGNVICPSPTKPSAK
jgi:hypothetical protein